MQSRVKSKSALRTKKLVQLKGWLKAVESDTPCVRCHKDLKPGQVRYGVHLIEGGLTILHPGDEDRYRPDGGDLGLHYLGADCAKKVGLDWCHPMEGAPEGDFGPATKGEEA